MKAAKIITVALIVIVSMIVSIDFQLKQQFGRSLDDPRGAISVPGIREEVTVGRDSLGVPYIDAKNEDDLFFATGYVHASDRLWQMTMLNMAMQGRLAEIAGDDYLGFDLFIRSLGVGDVIDDAMKKINGRSRAVLESFSQGVNAYVESHPHLPAEFFLTGFRPEPWVPRDTMFVFAMLSLNLSFNFIEELDFLNLAARVGFEKAAYLVPVYPDQDLPFDETRKLAEIDCRELNRLAGSWNDVRKQLRETMSISIPASNNWAVSGKKTRSGKSIICNDTHLALMMPNVWMMMHQKCPGFESAGVTAPGIPIVSLGFNGRTAWGATLVMADNQDIFIEELKVIQGKIHYRYRGQWVPARVHREQFRIKGRGSIVRNIIYTVHGPLLNNGLANMPLPPEMPVQPLPVKSRYGMSLCWGIGDAVRTLDGFLKLGQARNAAEVRNAVLDMESIYLNIVYGDGDHIGWQVSGRLPLRKKGTGQLPSPGWDGEYDWAGMLPVTANPHSEDPADGFIATANNRTVEKNYPIHISSSWFNPERAERQRQVLGRIDNVSANDMVKLQFDHYSPMAKKIQRLLFHGRPAREIRRAVRSMTDDGAARAWEALEFLKPERFNAVMDKDSAPAAVLGAFMHAAVRGIFLDELGPEGSVPWESFQDASMISYSAQQDHILGREDSPFWNDINTKENEGKWRILAEALDRAILLCEDRMGSNRQAWKWGRLHTYRWAHDFTKKIPFFHGYLNRGPYPASGDGHTLDVATPSWGDSFDVYLIPAMRLIVDFGLEEPARLVCTPGQSGNPSSDHYDDMLPYWLNGKNYPLPFGKEAVEKQYHDVLVMKPKTPPVP